MTSKKTIVAIIEAKAHHVDHAISQLFGYGVQVGDENKKILKTPSPPVLCIATTAENYSYFLCKFAGEKIKYELYEERKLMIPNMASKKEMWLAENTKLLEALYSLLVEQVSVYLSK